MLSYYDTFLQFFRQQQEDRTQASLHEGEGFQLALSKQRNEMEQLRRK